VVGLPGFEPGTSCTPNRNPGYYYWPVFKHLDFQSLGAAFETRRGVWRAVALASSDFVYSGVDRDFRDSQRPTSLVYRREILGYRNLIIAPSHPRLQVRSARV
jgi:hypothetical protein